MRSRIHLPPHTLGRLLFCCTLALTASIATPPQATAENAHWSAGTAFTLPAQRWEVGLFQPLRYGLTDTVELSTHPLTDTIAPALTAKIALPKVGAHAFAIEHTVRYPTPMLRLLSREGIGGVWAADAEIPHIIALESAVLTTLPYHDKHWLSTRLAFTAAPRVGDADWQSVDLPLITTRTAAYHDGVSLRAGLDADGVLAGPVHYLLDVDVFWMPVRDDSIAVEHAGTLTWRVSDGFALTGGYKFVWGQYPFGTDWHLLPLADLAWAW